MVSYDSDHGWVLGQQSPAWFLNHQPSEYIPLKSAPQYPSVCTDAYTTFFFDSEEGSDDNDGLSPEAPKKTLKEASTVAERHGAKGLRLLFKAGSSFTGNLVLGGFEASPEQPVIIDRYPEQSDLYPKLEGDGDVVRITTGNVRIYHLEITGVRAYRGIFCAPVQCGCVKNIVIEGCYVHDINFDWIYPTDPRETSPDDIDIEAVCPEYKADGKTYDRYFYRYYGGIILLNFTDEDAGASWFENVWVVDNRVECVARTAITMYSRWSNKGGVGYGFNKPVDDTQDYNDPEKGIGYYVHKNVVFAGNYVDCAAGDGIVLSSVEHAFVERNTCYRANYLGRSNYWNAAIWVYNAKDCYFQYNEAAYTYMRHGSQDAQGFDLDNCCRDVYMQFNYCHHNEGGGLLMCNLKTPVPLYDPKGEPLEKDEAGEPVKQKIMGKWFNNYVYSNVFAYNGNPGDSTRSAFVTIAREVDHVYCANNTVIMDPNIPGQSLVNTEDESTFCYHHVYANNVFFSPRKTDARLTTKMMRESVFDNNLYWNVGAEILKESGDAHPVLEEPVFGSTDALCGYHHIRDFAVRNEDIHDWGRLCRVSPSLDADGVQVKDQRFLGAFSRAPEHKVCESSSFYDEEKIKKE